MFYKAEEIAKITSGTLIGDANIIATSISIDSRNSITATGVAFIAITGTNHDGHYYIEAMYRRGVRVFVVEHIPEKQEYGKATFIVVDNSLTALQSLATNHRQRFKGILVAITGSNGKTIVKEWIAQLWDGSGGKIFRSPRSYNSQIGVALSLLMIDSDEQLAVIEAGISKPGEMERLEKMIRPDIGIITNIGEAHSENFHDNGQKLREKLTLFRHSRYVIYNRNQRFIEDIIFELYPDKLIPCLANPNNIEEQNSTLATCLYNLLELPHKPISDLQPVAMRLELQQGVMGSLLINDSYNCDVTSLEIALDYQGRQKGTRNILILSDILQSGLSSRELYAAVAGMLLRHRVDSFIGIGKEISTQAKLFGRGQFFEDTDQFLDQLNLGSYAGACILIKGSRPFGFERICHALEQRTHTTILEVNLDAMRSNLNYFREKLNPGCRLMAMVKAHSYGSGAGEVASMLEHEGVDYLAVAFADEGVALRRCGIVTPIVVLNSDPGSFAVMAENNLEPEIYSFSSLKAYIDETRKRGMSEMPIHIKLDTGMHRLGFSQEEIKMLISILHDNEAQVRVRTIFSHLAAADDPTQDEFTNSQITLFETTSSQIKEGLCYGDGILLHICNSAAIERLPQAHFDMVRLGIGLYGSGITPDKLQCVSTLKSHIVQIKEIHSGETVGYGRHGVISQPTRIAIIPIGYADGLNRRLSRGVGHFNIGGKLCPIVGNICMDTSIVDVTHLESVSEGDPVVIFGQNPTIDQIADQLGTISYEILTSVSSRIKRIYLSE